jgi:hypothetical protein
VLDLFDEVDGPLRLADDEVDDRPAGLGRSSTAQLPSMPK